MPDPRRHFPGFAAATAVACAAALALLLTPSALALDVDELMRRIDRLWRGDTSRSSMSMTVKTRRYERTMTMEAWSLGKDHSLVRIRDPIKDRGIATLKAGENIWNYLPKIDRVTKVPSSMMGGSWMGSHFTNDDLVKENTYEDDYDTELTFEGDRDGRAVYELSSLPKPDAAVVWGRVVTEVDQGTLAPIRSLYYDEEGTLVRTLAFDQERELRGLAVPMRLTLRPEDKPEEATVIVYHEIELDVPLDAGFFSLQSLKRRR